MRSMLMRRTKWFFINAIFITTLYFALCHSVAGATRVAEFYIWTTFILSWFSLNDDVARDVQKKNGRPCVPIWVDVLIDTAIVFALVWHGWIWCSIAYALQAVLGNFVWRELPVVTPEPAVK